MNTQWKAPNRTLAKRATAFFSRQSHKIPLRHRLDVVLLTGLLVSLIGLVGFWVAGVETADRFDWFEGAAIRPIADDRLLVNVRDDIMDQPLLDAAAHLPDGRIYISQQGGKIHLYDAETGLWSSEQPFSQDDPIQQDLVMLRSGCGSDPLSERVAECPDMDSLWAVSREGGLVRKGNDWQIIVSDTAFVGANGTPIESNQLTTAAVSPDNRWLVVGTENEGVGIYDIERHQWLPLGQDFFANLPSLSVTHLLWWQERFWIGGPAGLISLQMGNTTPRLIEVAEMDHHILDLDADAQEGGAALWILAQRACDEGGNDCLWLAKLSQPAAEPQVLIHERNHFSALSLTDLIFAQQHEDQLTVAGDAGIFSYDTVLHSWQRRFDKRVNTALPLPEEQPNGFYFAFSGAVGLIEDNKIQTWEIPDKQVVKLLYGREGEVLVLTEAGNLFALDGSDEAKTVFKGSNTGFEPESFTSAVALADAVLLVGTEGALLHHTVTRRYEDIPNDFLPEWLLNTAFQPINTGNHVYVLSPSGANEMAIYTLPADQIAKADYFLNKEYENATSTSVPAPVTRLWKWEKQGIGLLAGDGSVYQLTPQGKKRLTGASVAELDNLPLRDVAEVTQDLVIATDQGLRRYDSQSRAWGSVFQPPADQRALEIASVGDKLLMRTERGRLIQNRENNPVLIGDETGFEIGDQGLSDAREENQHLYFAGNGRVEQYDTTARQITQRWDLPGNAQVGLKEIINQQPLALTQGTATLGETIIDAEAGVVSTLSSSDQYVWSVRENGGQPYLKGYPYDSSIKLENPRCFFRNRSTGGGATEILDARSLPDGPIAVATNAGLRFYSTSARSWFAAPDNLIPRNGRSFAALRMTVVDKHLLLSEERENDFRLSFIPLQSINIPNSCSTDVVSLDAKQIEARAVSIDEASGQVAWVALDGAVITWQAGQESERLPATRSAPARADLRRVFDRQDHLLFTTDNTILHYELAPRRWKEISLQFDSSVDEIADINIEQDSNGETVLVQSKSGTFHLGHFVPAADSVSMSQIFSPTPSANLNPQKLLDVQDRGDGLWTFVLEDEIKYFDPRRRSWLPGVEFSEADPSREYQRAVDLPVVIADRGKILWVADPSTGSGSSSKSAATDFARYELNTNETTALDESGTIWRLPNDGRLWRCPAPTGDQKEYECSRDGPETFYLEQNEVRQAWEWQNIVLFETNTGLRAFNPATRAEIALPEEVRTFQNIEMARQFGQQLWLRSSNNLLILDKNANNEVAGTLLADMQALRFDQNGQPWARFQDGWQIWRNGTFETPQTENAFSAQEAGITLFAVEGATTTGIDGQGFPYWWDNQLVADELTLPSDITINNITGLLRTNNGDWWVQSGNRLDYVARTTCPGVALPPSTSNEAITPTAQNQQPIATGTPTATPTPTVTPTPEPVPCLQIMAQVDLPADFGSPNAIIYAQIEANGTLELLKQDNTAVRIEKDSAGQYQVTTNQDVAPTLAGAMNDEWPTLQTNVVTLQNGRAAYDPIIALKTNNQGPLIAETPNNNIQLAARAALAQDFERPLALDATWLRWDRAQNSFIVASPSGPLTLSRTQFIVGGRLLFEPIEAILAETPTKLHVANQHGVWTYSQSDLRANDSTIIYQPISLSTPIQAAHGRFMTPGEDLPLGQNALQPASAIISLNFGDVQLTEAMRSRNVSGTVTIGGEEVDAFADSSGFIWDSARRGVAYSGTNLLLQSDAGIHPVDQLANFDPGPNDLGRESARLRSESGALFLLDDETWYQNGAAGWTESANDPTANRTLLNNSTWRWELQNGQLEITLTGTAHQFAHAASGNGYTFSSDQLLAAAVIDNQLYVASNAFLEIASQPDDLATLTASRLAPITSDKLQDVTFADGTKSLFNYDNDKIYRWDAATSQFVAINPSDDPLQTRKLIENSRLRFTLEQNQVIKELKIDDIAGNDSWVRFDFVGGQFPFDVVTSIASLENELYVGTAAGLQVYSADLSVALNNLNQLYDLRRQSTGPLATVSRVGIPKADVNLLMARSDAACIERRAGGSFTPCDDSSLLDTRLRVRNDLWQWTSAANGNLEGQYRDHNGNLTSVYAALFNGRFPHDHLDDVISCNGRAFSMWQADWITVYPDSTIALKTGLENYPLDANTPQRFICIERDIPLVGATIARGLYMEGGEQQIWRFSDTEWSDITDPKVIAGLLERADKPPIFDRQRLRLLAPSDDQAFHFEQRALSNQWQPLAWETGRVAIDHWRELLTIDDQLWVATPAGLLPFQRAANGPARLDVDKIHIVREPTDEQGTCQVTDLAIEKDLTQNKESEMILARCHADSAQVYRGRLNEKQDRDVFEPIEGTDPFAEQELVSKEATDYWQWHLTGHEGGNPGYLVGQLREDNIQLVNGVFEFDTINSLALFDDEQLEIATDAGGWFRASRESLHVRDFQRPTDVGIDPLTINGVGMTRVADAPLLCLQQNNNNYFRLAQNEEPEQTESCPEYLADDHLWRYTKENQELAMTARNSIGGAGTRQLQAGRFTDDLIIGLPITAQTKEDNQPYYLLPTQAGVLHLDHNLKSQTIHAAPFEGLPDNNKPTALFMLDAETPIYANQNTFYQLDNAREALANFDLNVNLDLPNNATLQRIENGPQNLLRIRWHNKNNNQQGWSLMQPDDWRVLPANTLSIDLTSLPKYTQRRVEWDDPTSWMILSLQRTHLDTYWLNPNEPYRVNMPTPLNLITPILAKERLLLIGTDELMEINLEKTMIEAFEALD